MHLLFSHIGLTFKICPNTKYINSISDTITVLISLTKTMTKNIR